MYCVIPAPFLVQNIGSLSQKSQLQRLSLIEPRAASVVFELQKYNPLLFDLALKRNLEWQGRRFPRQIF